MNAEVGRSVGVPTVLAWTLWAAAVLISGIGLALFALNWSTEVPDAWGVRGVEVILVLAFATVGALIASRRPKNPIGWIYLAVAALFSIGMVTKEYAYYALLTQPGSWPGGLVMAWLGEWIWVLFVGLLLVYFVSLFPDGRFLSPRWRSVGWLGAIGIITLTFAFAVRTGPMTSSASFADNPYQLVWLEERVPFLLQLGFVLYMIPVAAAATSLFLRFRRARGDERQQLKWLATVGALGGVSLVLQPSFSHVKALQVVTLIGISGIPLGAGLAILRYRLYDIDIIVNQALVYGALTASLGGTYFASVVLLQMAFRAATGQGNAVAIVISTLAIAALFVPLRRSIQNVIDRRFYRRRYDTARTLAAFSARMRDEVDVDRLTGELVAVVQGTMQPVHASLWLREGSRNGGRNDPETIAD